MATFTRVILQTNDVLAVYSDICAKLHHKQLLQPEVSGISKANYEELYRKYEEERAKHSKTSSALAAEKENKECLQAELNVLRKQLEREKDTFERAFGLLRSEALADSSRTEDLLAKCTALESLCARKDKELEEKDQLVSQLHQKIHSNQQTHKHELRELNIKMQQEVYMARRLAESTKKSHRTRK